MRVPQNLGMSRVLSQVFTSKSFDSLSLSDYIGTTATQQPSTLTQLGIDATVYTTSCTATLATAASAQAGFSFAPASITLSLNATLSSNSSSGLSVTVGTFDSPLWVFATSGPDSLYSDLLMLAWRVNNKRASDTLYYLAHARGLTSSQVTSDQLTANTALNSSLTAGYLVVSSKASLDVARKVTDQLSATFEDTVIDLPLATDFLPIPSVTDLQSAISSVQLTASGVSTYVLLHLNDPAVVTQDVVGVPQDMCTGQGTRWAIADTNPAQTSWRAGTGPPLTKASVDSLNMPHCAFTFNLINNSNGTTGFIASPTITGKYQGTSFTLNMAQIPITASQFPQFASRVTYDQTGKFASSGPVPILEYKVAIPVAQAANLVGGYNSMSWMSDPITATCINNTTINLQPPDTSSLPISAAGSSAPPATLDYLLSDAKGNLDQADAKPIQCTLASGSLQFNDSSAANTPPVSRSLTAAVGLGIKLPHIKPALSLRKIANTGTSYTFGGTIASIKDISVLTGSSASLMDGNVNVKTGRINPDFTIDFDPVVLEATKATQSQSVCLRVAQFPG